MYIQHFLNVLTSKICLLHKTNSHHCHVHTHLGRYLKMFGSRYPPCPIVSDLSIVMLSFLWYIAHL